MYCPVCFQNTLKIRSSGVIKLSFNGKSRNTSLFTYNLQKETQEQLDAKLREKIVDFFSFYAEFNNKTPIKVFELYSADFICTNTCKIDVMNTSIKSKLKSINNGEIATTNIGENHLMSFQFFWLIK
jgi:hypothetical protein